MDKKGFPVKAALVAVLCLVGFILPLTPAHPAPQPGDILPNVELRKPAASGELAYLGLSGSGTFSLTDIPARIVIVEFFSMYCPYCQAEAQNTVNLYNDIQRDSALKGNVKLIGVGVGNSDYEVSLFKDKYAIPFPLLSDADGATIQSLQLQYTPHFLVVRIEKGGAARVLYSQPGSIGDPRTFLDKIIRF